MYKQKSSLHVSSKETIFPEIKMHFSRNTSLSSSSSSSCFTSMEFWQKEKTARWKQDRSRETKQISRGKYGCFLSLVKETNKKKHNYHMPKFCFQLIHWFYFQPSWPFLQNKNIIINANTQKKKKSDQYYTTNQFFCRNVHKKCRPLE